MADNENQAVLPYIKQVRRKRSDNKVLIDETLRIYFRGTNTPLYSCPTAIRSICGEFNSRESTEQNPIIFSESSMKYKSHGGTVTYHTSAVLEFLSAYLNARIYVDNKSLEIKVKTNIYEHVLDKHVTQLLTNWGNSYIETTLDVNQYQKKYAKSFIPLLAHAQKWEIPLLEHDIYIYLACMTFARGMYSYSLYSAEVSHQRQAGNDISDTDE